METITTPQIDFKSNSSSRPEVAPASAELARPLPPAPSADVPLGPGALPDSEFLLSSIRTATLRARLVANELDTVGLSLKRELISVEGAIAWLSELKLLDHLDHMPLQ
jgi:hypothetical protein